jgi:alanyl-tRNA synthetase
MAKIQELDELRATYLNFFASKGHLIHPSASLKSSDPTLMFNVAGMQQFKPQFQGAPARFEGFEGEWRRVVTSQKCMRAGGKDSDIENVGRTRRHHTFFEMLGNFSFGDYFKAEAAAWAWEFLTDPAWLGLDPERLHVTVFQDDDEAWDIWTQQVGVPVARMSRWGEDQNFWPANAVKDGRSGPCGPCSEIFYDRGPDFGSPDETGPNTGSGDRFMEVWNLVFTQFDLVDGELRPLPMQNIDTGMGFERLASVVTGAVDAYATELFQPSIRRLVEASGVPYRDLESVPHRIVADHVRSVTMCIADGILPTNDGPGYVIKMLIRRAARQAWQLGVRRPVLFELVAGVAESMGNAYPEVREQAGRIAAIVQAEEAQFLETLEAGIERVQHVLDGLGDEVLPGEVAFDLWQTYGFPLDLTVEMAAERGLSVDRAGYAAARERARTVSRAGGGKATMFAAVDALAEVAAAHAPTRFLGFEAESADATVVGLVAAGGDGDPGTVDRVGEGAAFQLVLDATPCYAEGGGQVGDAGKVTWTDAGGRPGAALLLGTVKGPQGLIVHRAQVARGELRLGQAVRVLVDPARRETQKHHTATHLLHAALRRVVGEHVAQAGSLVVPDRLRFDVSHGAPLTPEQLQAVETMVNGWIQADLPVAWRVVPLAEARAAGAMMLFGEKYGGEVRMVCVGGEGDCGAPATDTRGSGFAGTAVPSSSHGAAPADARASGGAGSAKPDPAVSIELCGGTHVARTGEIGSFLIVAEEAASAGVRRLEALTGRAAVAHVQQLRAALGATARALGAKPDELEARVGKLQAELKAAHREVAHLRDKLAASQTGDGPAASEIAGVRTATLALEGLDAAALRNAADTLMQRSGADLVVVGSGLLLVVKASEAARARGAQAGRVVKALAERGGGGGGGRPDMAQAGVKDHDGLRSALAALPEVLAQVVQA